MAALPPNHFLALPRPDVHFTPAVGTPDTSTLAAHDFDVDTRTGFMPPQPPLARLPAEWESWEATLDDGLASKLQLSDRADVSAEDRAKTERWRSHVRNLPIISIAGLKSSELLLRRAHHVLAWVMHLFVHTTPQSETTINIPPPITVPLLQVSAQLQLPPVLTYSDDVLYNWAYKTPPENPFLTAPALDNLRCLTLFTGTRDEEEFYLTSARIELRGVEALSIMRSIMDEAFVGDTIALRRITTYLGALAGVIAELSQILGTLRQGCDPHIFYNDIRPWFKGADSDTRGRKWVFEGIERDPTLEQPAELSGPSAGQSTLVHALDIFLGVDRYSHSLFSTHGAARSTATLGAASGTPAVPFLTRMQSYMPRHHRTFLRHLAGSPRPLRALVENAGNAPLRAAYDGAVKALKEFRDEHVRIVALYILVPSKREGKEGGPKGTGGTDAFQFVKGVRDQTAGALLGEGR
ncbi:Indoleamine 2,3-dioxygenase 1, partial [Grifola frondosa]